MRRTEQEFKAEILRRSDAYRQARARRRKNILGISVCACLCIAVLAVLAPMGEVGSDNAAMAADMVTTGGLRSEAPMAQNPEEAPECAIDDAAPAENEPAAGIAEAASSAEPAAVKIVCGIEEIILDAADSAIIMDYLSSDEWVRSAANCLFDYTLYVNGETYRYHSDCGTIQDGSGNSLTLSEADKENVSEILESYTN